MGLFKKKANRCSNENINEESDDNNHTYVMYVDCGEKWIRYYNDTEVELIKKEAYEQGFQDGVASRN